MRLEIDPTNLRAVDLKTFSNGTRSAIGWVQPGETDRKVNCGPMIPGPWLYAYGLSTCIHDGPYEAKMPAITVETGDRIAIVERGVTIVEVEITVTKRGYIEMETVESAYTAQLSAITAKKNES